MPSTSTVSVNSSVVDDKGALIPANVWNFVTQTLSDYTALAKTYATLTEKALVDSQKSEATYLHLTNLVLTQLQEGKQIQQAPMLLEAGSGDGAKTTVKKKKRKQEAAASSLKQPEPAKKAKTQTKTKTKTKKTAIDKKFDLLLMQLFLLGPQVVLENDEDDNENGPVQRYVFLPLALAEAQMAEDAVSYVFFFYASQMLVWIRNLNNRQIASHQVPKKDLQRLLPKYLAKLAAEKKTDVCLEDYTTANELGLIVRSPLSDTVKMKRIPERRDDDEKVPGLLSAAAKDYPVVHPDVIKAIFEEHKTSLNEMRDDLPGYSREYTFAVRNRTEPEKSILQNEGVDWANFWKDFGPYLKPSLAILDVQGSCRFGWTMDAELNGDESNDVKTELKTQEVVQSDVVLGADSVEEAGENPKGDELEEEVEEDNLVDKYLNLQ